MKFSHISDTHLGQYRSKKEREDDTYDVFKQAIEISIKDKVDFVIFSGDIFDKAQPPNDAILTMMQQLNLLKENGIESYFVLGDHDQPKVVQNPIHALYSSLTKVSHHLEDGKPVYFKNVLLVGFDHQMPGHDIESLQEDFKKIDLIAKEHDGHKIIVLHQALMEAHYHAGELNANDLPKNFTYYAIGDIHGKFGPKKYEFLGGPLAYPGSTEISSTEAIKETKKGFFEVDISSTEAIPKWIELDTRPRFEIETSVDELHVKIDEVISKIDESRKPLVSLTITDVHDWKSIQQELARLDEHILDKSVHLKYDEKQYPLSLEDTGNIDEEFKRLATKNVGQELANLALETLYPSLNEKNKREVKEIIIRNFEKFKEEHKK